jgi:glutaredoxin
MIEIFGKTQCPYCDKAKSLCEKEGLEYTYKQLDTDFTREELFEEFPTARTFPQIRVRETENTWTYIGGYDQLAEYVKHGDVWED